MTFSGNYFLYIAVAAIILSLAALIWTMSFEWRLKRLFRGSGGADLKGVLTEQQRKMEQADVSISNIKKYLEGAEPRLRRSVKYVGVVRFNSFADVGGNQSFAAAFLDEHHNGIVFSSLYGRDTNRVYAKPLENGKSQYALTDEEKEAISKALS
ncbi:MAG: DUF4446 family protein [Candidatus Niyogibacteria bacterium]|nr:DUF4446 family protein [Candidatus Niyogibacteria bacterium]